MEFLKGGDIFQHLKKKKKFSEKQVKFIIACLTSALGHLHNKKYIYRDLKPENILLDENGYVKLSDFGCAKFLENKFTDSFCGTAEYLAPERILNRNYDWNVDWWSLGILCYELLYGIPPFYCVDRKKMFKRSILNKVCFDKRGIRIREDEDEEKLGHSGGSVGKRDVKKKEKYFREKKNENGLCFGDKNCSGEKKNNFDYIKKKIKKDFISEDCKDFIKQLLRKSPKNRLGSKNGSLDIIGHKWFKNFDWKNLMNKTLKPPFCPLENNKNFLDNFDAFHVKEKANDSFCKVDPDFFEKFHKDFEKFYFIRENISFQNESLKSEKFDKNKIQIINKEDFLNKTISHKVGKKEVFEKDSSKNMIFENKDKEDNLNRKKTSTTFKKNILKNDEKNSFFESQINQRIKKNQQNVFKVLNRDLKKKVNKNKGKILKYLNKEKIKKNISIKNLKKQIIMKSIFTSKKTKKSTRKILRSWSFEKINILKKKSFSIDSEKYIIKIKC